MSDISTHQIVSFFRRECYSSNNDNKSFSIFHQLWLFLSGLDVA